MEEIKNGKKLFNAVIVIVVFGLSAYVAIYWVIIPIITLVVLAIEQFLGLEVSVKELCKIAGCAVIIFVVANSIERSK